LRAVVIAADITAFHVLGAILALWAVVLFALGVASADFPPKGAERFVIAISALLVAGTISAAIITGGETKKKGEEVAGAKNRTGKEGSAPPQGGGTPAPGTGSGSGQQSGGNAQPQPGQSTGQTLLLSADPSGALRFDKNTLQAKKGVVKIVMNNPATVQHNISIEGPGGLNKEGPIVGKGGSSQVSAKLGAGSYTYYCAVPGHRQAGMQGTLTVK
jgi:plastocyanin